MPGDPGGMSAQLGHEKGLPRMLANDRDRLEAIGLTGPLTRRRLLRGMGAGLAGLSLASLAAACGGTAATPTTAAPPTTAASGGGAAATSPATTGSAASPAAGGAYAPPTISPGSHTLKLLMWSHFVPAFDEFFDKYAKDWGAKNKVTVSVDHVPTNTVTTTAAGEVAANAGHDMTLFQTGTDVHLFADKLIDVTPLANYFGSKYGGWASMAETAATVQGVWKGIPEYFIPFPGIYRKDLFDQEGLKPVDTWDDLLNVGKKLKPKQHPAGIAISATGDSNSTWYGCLWGFGGAVSSKDGKTVTINSPETRAMIEYAVSLYKDGMTEEVLSWDDASNNRLIASGIASWISNPISAYRSSSPDMQKNLYISQPPAGPKGRLMNASAYTWSIWQWSKEAATAQKFLSDYYNDWKLAFEASTGYNNPLLKGFEKKPMPVLGSDPKLEMLQGISDFAQTIGYPGPATAAAAKVNNTFVIPNMLAKAVASTKPLKDAVDEAIAYAENEIKSIYATTPTI